MNRKIKVLRIVSNLGIGGVQKQILSLIKNIDSEKFMIDVLAVRRGGKLETEFSRCCRTMVLDLKGKYSLIDLFKLFKVIKRGKYDIVHIHRMEDILPLSITACILAGVRVKVIHHHFPYKWLSKRKKLIEQFFTKSADWFVAVSHFTSKYMVERLQLETIKSSIIYNGVELLSVSDLRVKEDIVGIVARIVYFKKLDSFIRSAKVVQDIRRNIEFIITGTGRKSREIKLKKLASDIGAEIKWTGEVYDVEDVIRLFKIGILSSVEEGLGNVVLEYMTLDTLALASNIPPIWEVIIDGKTGFLFMPSDYFDMAKAILLGLDNCSLRKKVVMNAIKRVESFSIKRTAEATVKLYESVLRDL